MKAMILAAGLGTRLKPLTDTRPKALVEINGRTLLEITLTRLAKCGISDFIINVHHFADQIVDYLKAHNNFGVNVELSREEDLLLDTGGGLKKAAWFFRDGREDEPFLVHNVDVVSNIDLGAMAQCHREREALATLAVQARPSSRLLLFNEQLQLTGRARSGSLPVGNQPPFALAFAGIHFLSPRLLPLLSESGVFSIIDSYVRLAALGHKILAFRADPYYWRDLGRPADLAQAAADLQQKLFS